MLSVRLKLLPHPGASRDGDGDGGSDGANKVPQNTWAVCRLKRAESDDFMAWWGGLHACLTGHCELRRASSPSQDTLALRAGRDDASVVSLLTTSPWRQASLHAGSSLERGYMHRVTQRWPANPGFEQSRESNPTDI